MAMGMEVSMEEARSIHRLDTYGLVCDMLKLIDRRGQELGLAFR